MTGSKTMWYWHWGLMKCWIGQWGNENTQRESQMNTATEWRDFSKSLHQKKLILYSPCDKVGIRYSRWKVCCAFKDVFFYILCKIVFLPFATNTLFWINWFVQQKKKIVCTLLLPISQLLLVYITLYTKKKKSSSTGHYKEKPINITKTWEVALFLLLQIQGYNDG